MSANTQAILDDSALRRRNRWRHLLREPLLHFVILGGAIFIGMQTYDSAARGREIVIDESLKHQLAQTFKEQFGASPSAAELQRLVDGRLREEILVREALALGLDRDDEIIRRRLAQKYEFLQQDLESVDEPSQRQLQNYYEQHLSNYTLPPRVTFTHIYFSPDAGDAEAKARRTLGALHSQPRIERAPQLGDPFPELYDYASLGPQELERLFGPSSLAQALTQVPVRQWSGPYRSGFGWHLVYVSSREAEHTASLDEVRDRVRGDYLREARARKNDAAFAKLAAKYTIRTVPSP